MSLRPLEEVTLDPAVVGKRRRNVNYERNCSSWVLQLLNTHLIILYLKKYSWRKVAKRVTIENCTLLEYYHYSLRNNPEERSSYPSRGGSVKSQRHKVCETWKQSLIFPWKSCYNNITTVSRYLLHKERSYVEVYFGFDGDFSRTGNGVLNWRKRMCECSLLYHIVLDFTWVISPIFRRIFPFSLILKTKLYVSEATCFIPLSNLFLNISDNENSPGGCRWYYAV
jgi:glycosyltransferase involved in cell wall biosynthesis